MIWRFILKPLNFVTLAGMIFHHPKTFAESYLIYKVMPGDTLSEVLYAHGARPIYGKKGSLKKTIEINSGSISSNGNIIYPNLMIRLPVVIKENDSFVLEKGHSENPEPVVSEPERQVATSLPIQYSSEEKSNSVFSFGPRLSFAALSAVQNDNGTKAFLKSGMNYGFSLQWLKSWNDHFQSILEYQFSRFEFEKPISRNLLNSGLNVNAISAGMVFTTDCYSLGLKLSADERIVLDAISLTDLQLDKVSTSSISLLPGWKFMENESGVFGVEGEVAYSTSARNANVTAKSGFNTFGGKVYLSQNLNLGRIIGGIFIKQYRLSTELIDQTVLEEGMAIHYEIPFGKLK